MKKISDLRELLDLASYGVTPERNLEMVQKIAIDIPHNIVPVLSSYDLARFTCVMHAFEFVGNQRYSDIASLDEGRLFAGKAFMNWMLSNKLLVEVDGEANSHSLVVYFSELGSFTHIGLRRKNGRVESKWGSLGLYEHDLFEIPASYGSAVRYFNQLPSGDAFKFFCDYAREKGARFV